MLDVHFPTTDGRSTLILSRHTELNAEQKTSGPATQTRSSAAATASHHRTGKYRSQTSQRRVVKTFTARPLILFAFSPELGKLG
jgi:hypothetical protein